MCLEGELIVAWEKKSQTELAIIKYQFAVEINISVMFLNVLMAKLRTFFQLYV